MVCLRISAKRSLHSTGRPFIATREAIHSMSARGLPDYWSLLKPQPRSDPQIGVFSVEREALGGLLSHAIEPWMRGAPQSWFSVLICLISARNSISIRGRPPREFDFQRQKRRKPARCHRTSVSGWTIVTTSRINGNHRYIWTRNQRRCS